ncbi:PEPxxWA-CTERM sorting domain-containing protein [Novosphingobium sp. PASSN1]|uniref:PEPxxWA-CTERM sorting domain-containing protein n=1 Tax=Novosphingobium sp. PASSN1 TaxID=2015561 RepID=UPI000BC552E2|nr:PEPxxWA-CTERM sorting domain-containing protein [Novosphingobium sp. PASSN1]OYU34252.1 MAG: hypothetical protein CFE35_16725 [Novosphingobium sp. PASSN1]
MFRTAIRVALPVAAALLATAASAAITYNGSVTPIRQFGAGTLTVDYAITTDGSLGSITIASITNYSLTFNYNGTITTYSTTDAPTDDWPETRLVASATTLSMDFTRVPGAINQFTLGPSAPLKQITFSSHGNEILGPPNTGSITAFYVVPPAIFAGYSLPGAGLQVIGTAAAAVPEPASWALLIAGFGLTGAALRRHRALATA